MELSQSANFTDTRYDEWSTAHATDTAHLIERSRHGDIQAFNLLVERYQQRVYAVCWRMLGDIDAEDAAQEVFLAAFRSIRHYRGGSFSTWLLRIASNKCLDFLRASSRRVTVSLDRMATGSDDGTPVEISDQGESPEHRVLRMELARSLELTLQELPADQRLAVVLSDIQGYSNAEIISATGWPAGTVKSRLSRGRARLRDTLRSLAAGPG